ncbi:MAG: hypothetical protein M1834_008651 [Cirrosporium novae-zelandiae]|nr:MAG: hypothetical protein M1834_008651 [Cirrosporium novae-zelandiae]
MFPGVTRPYGVVKLGPDLYTGSDAYSGYLPTGNVTGVSLTHESGTGGAPKYGVVSQLPLIGNISNPLTISGIPRAEADEAKVGYYKLRLSSGVGIELAASDHSALFEYSFPSGTTSNVLVDISHVLPSFRGQGLGQNYTGGNITIASDDHYEGSGTYNNGWNRAPDWTIYFCGRFDKPASSIKVFSGTGEALSSYGATNSSFSSSQSIKVGAVYSFSTQSLTSRVGVSFMSSAKACHYIDTEIANSSLSTLVSETKQIWNENVLSKVTTTETNVTNLQLLYTSLYGMFIIPTNKTGENPLWSSSEPYYDDIFTFWDLFRCTTPLWQILQPTAYEEQIRSLIDIWRHEGYLPDARSSLYNGRTQGGSNGDNVLADAYIKGVRGAVNWEDGYAAMVKDAEVTPKNTNPPDPMAPDSSTKEGRGALPDWLKYGYITPSYSRSVSRAAEYALNDFALFQVASGLNKSTDATKYLNRSRNWRNHWNPMTTSLNFSGFLVPRYANGTFDISQDPLSCGDCYWSSAYYEALPWEYSFSPHHDISTLIALSGGPATFTSKLLTLFVPNLNPSGSSTFNYTIFNPGNEPSFTSPYLFIFSNRYDLAVHHARKIATSYYSPTPSGLPGNSDAGAMQSWLLWNMLGLYPLTSQTIFLIGSPWFESLSINLGQEGKYLNITAEGGGGDPATNYYVQELKVNKKSWDRAWVSWGDVFEHGGTMEFVLGETAGNWTAGGSVPPSPAAGG